MTSDAPATFSEFWPSYLRDHSRSGTRALHYLGTLLALGCLGAAMALPDWRLALAAPLIGYGLAWTGHFALEGNRPATWQHPVWSFASDFRMLGLALTGRLHEELRRHLPDGDQRTENAVMSLKDFVGQGWNDHASDAEAVFDRLPQGLELVESSGDALSLSSLVVHVAGEHLGRWDEGLSLLESLLEHAACEGDEAAAAALNRSRAVLLHCAGNAEGCDAALAKGLDPARPEGSSKIRVWAIAASALAGQGRVEEATDCFRKALDLADYGPTADDPAARALAITSNNLACELEEKAKRDLGEDELLREAALAARRFWEISGNWMNVERAEYRLAMTHVALGEPETALTHARLCLEICEANGAEAGEFFFANEARAKAQHAGGQAQEARQARNEAARQLENIENEGFQGFCRAELEKLDARLGMG